MTKQFFYDKYYIILSPGKMSMNTIFTILYFELVNLMENSIDQSHMYIRLNVFLLQTIQFSKKNKNL